MKQLTCIIRLIGIACIAIAPNLRAQTINGSLSDLKNGKLIITAQNEHIPGGLRNDTVEVIDGAFSYTLPSKHVTAINIWQLPEGNNPEKDKRVPQMISTIMVPGTNINLIGSFKEYHVSGSDFHLQYDHVYTAIHAYDVQRTDSLNKFLQQSNGNFNAATMNLLRESITPIEDARKQTIMNYIKAHPDSDVSVALIDQMYINEMPEAIVLLTPKARRSPFAELYQPKMRKLKAAQTERDKIYEMEGLPAPLFTLHDVNGKPLALESLRGKYLVLDFWGSWCGWCIKGMPKMKEYYEKYKGKLEILGIDCRDTMEQWRAAIRKHQLPWLQVRATETDDVVQRYNVPGFPTKFILDPQGNITKVVVGEDPAFYQYLDELFK